MAKQITYGQESRQSVLRDVNRLVDAVKVTAHKSDLPAMPSGGGMY